MNILEEMAQTLQQDYPDAKIHCDLAINENGTSWLDMEALDKNVLIEWRPFRGFGLHLSDEDDDLFGSGPKEVYRTQERLLKRLEMIFKESKERIKFKDIRELRGITQKGLAEEMGQQQSSISKLEAREDVYLKSIFRLIKALGGEIEIKVHFNDCDIPIDFSDLNIEKRNAG